ncbi:1-phosphofructokinase [Dehalococcoides mccartyi]|jgi:6-phosphofructokinase 2|uniref:1-phosphofructokinase n=1 Tax=Dehalococcoides mccartyi TaxID=61435 RepID=UPI0004E092AF|nr:1-phosphofructokinase [Dehalococcoides mccartyi]AII58299.1 carbohydrate kinase [Dehalococcoides mccartyi CG1]APH12875.1 1-phosphofructokinase [Dehalococcoides mccartyi]
MITTVTLNPCLDKHIDVHGLVLYETNRWHLMSKYAGGKGIDVSRAVHEMGNDTIACGFLGGEEGREIETLLAKQGLKYRFTPISQPTRSCFIIYDTKTRRQTNLNAPGPRITPSELKLFHEDLQRESASSNLIVMSGSVPPGIPSNVYFTLIKSAHKLGKQTILDATGKYLRAGLKAKPCLVKPNIREAEELLGRKLETEAEIILGAKEIVQMGAGIAVISMGKKGLIASDGKQVIKASSPYVRVKSAVGAGDSTVAGLAISLCRGYSLEEACRLGVAMGTAAVMTPGTELCHREDVQYWLPRIKIRRLA